MDENKVTLIIEINYDKSSSKIETEEIISYDELKEKIIELFNLEPNKTDNIELTYLDEDGDLNILGQEKDELFFAAKEIMEGVFHIKLKLSIIEMDKKNDYLFEEKNENNLAINRQDNLNEKDKNIKLIIEENEKFKKKIKNDLNLIYKSKLEDLKNKINNLVNEKYNSIENEITQLLYNENKNDLIKINKKDTDDINNILKLSDDDSDFVIMDKKDATIVTKNKKQKNQKEIHSNLRKIKDKMKSLIKEKNKTNLIIMKYGDEIYELMNKEENKIEIKDINDYLKNYLEQKGKENLRTDFVRYIGKIYKYIEIKKINKINLDFFEKGKSKENENNLIYNEINVDFKSQLDSLADTNKFKEEIIQNLLNYETIK